MRFLKNSSLLLAFFLAFSISQQAIAQTDNGDESKSLLDAAKDLFWGEFQEASYSNGNNTVKVVVSDLGIADRAAYGSIHSAFSGTEDLEVEDIAFAPDFGEGFFFLSFSTDSDDDTRVVILDVKGNEIHNEVIEDFEGTYESQVNIKSDEKGTYFLKIIQGFSLLNKKLEVE